MDLVLFWKICLSNEVLKNPPKEAFNTDIHKPEDTYSNKWNILQKIYTYIKTNSINQIVFLLEELVEDKPFLTKKTDFSKRKSRPKPKTKIPNPHVL